MILHPNLCGIFLVSTTYYTLTFTIIQNDKKLKMQIEKYETLWHFTTNTTIFVKLNGVINLSNAHLKNLCNLIIKINKNTKYIIHAT